MTHDIAKYFAKNDPFSKTGRRNVSRKLGLGKQLVENIYDLLTDTHRTEQYVADYVERRATRYRALSTEVGVWDPSAQCTEDQKQKINELAGLQRDLPGIANEEWGKVLAGKNAHVAHARILFNWMQLPRPLMLPKDISYNVKNYQLLNILISTVPIYLYRLMPVMYMGI